MNEVTGIEVLVSNGARAEAEDPESAALAALTLIDEARDAGQSGLTASFYVRGRLVRGELSRAAVASALAKQEEE